MADNKKTVISAGAWILFAYGLAQIVRLGSNLITTRILEPSLFGVMALVTLFLIAIEMFSDLGLWVFVVRHKTPEDPAVQNTVWSIQVLRGWFIFSIVGLLALGLYALQKYQPGLLGQVYLEPKLPILILNSGLSAIFAGYRSLASPLVSRDLNYKKLELAEIFSQILGVVVMLGWIYFKPSIWALAVPPIVTVLCNSYLSYQLFPYRHKFEINREVAKELFHFSKWIVISSVLTYCIAQTDRLYLAAKVSANTLGVYSVALVLSGTLVLVIQSLAYKIALPMLSKVVNEQRSELKQKYYQLRMYTDLPIFLGCGFLIAIGPMLIKTLYDERYISAGLYLQVLIFGLVGNMLTLVAMECLSALSDTKVRMTVMFIKAVILFGSLPLSYQYFGFIGVVWAASLNVWLAIPPVYLALKKHGVFSLFNELKYLPFVGVGYLLGWGFVRLIG